MSIFQMKPHFTEHKIGPRWSYWDLQQPECKTAILFGYSEKTSANSVRIALSSACSSGGNSGSASKTVGLASVSSGTVSWATVTENTGDETWISLVVRLEKVHMTDALGLPSVRG